eukprot:4569308-Amphidinium_carterae.1
MNFSLASPFGDRGDPGPSRHLPVNQMGAAVVGCKRPKAQYWRSSMLCYVVGVLWEAPAHLYKQ